ncbi:ligand-gated channel [Methylopila jiangsuensis]|uniref:Ligand-gated channel n=1 Tax=Methylopila jiangsuensis TaxID=586230 RepID=A0A9W6JDF4_9HYPH|nr:TonB-dependent hemoglobin/transferrin/lactoferrin family receptor [Methylopila jiangsuensis]MDR6285754.1 TonB-dependent heme/hemoglobin receptor [Methylopila jiangsuensis]GLK75511.1 ligand-gated channel [Methylopila jiangsuensis]
MSLGARLLASAAFGAATISGTSAAGAQSAQETYRFAIPSKPLGSAIAEIGAVSGWRVAYTAPLPAGARSPALAGVYTAPQALALALAGTGLQSRVTGERSITLAPTSANATAITGALGEDGAEALDPIEVTSGGSGGALAGPGWQGAPDRIYETPSSAAYVGRAAMDERGGARNAGDMLRGVSGVNAVIDRQNPGVNVNIRGLQDQGRVNMTIDGARQNFQQAGHGSSAFAFVDPELLSAVEVEKGPTSTAGGAGVIGGVVTFRTLDASDLIVGDKDYGVRLNTTTGTNAFDFNGSAAFGAKVGDGAEVVAAVGRKKLGEYDAGKHGRAVKQTRSSGEQPISDYVTQDQWSWLMKAVLPFTDTQKLTLSYVGLSTDFTTGNGQYIDTNDITNHTATADYRWTPGDPWFDLNVKAYYTRTENTQFRPARVNGLPDTDVDYAIDTVGGSLQNVSRLEVSGFALAATYGAEYFFDKTDTVANSAGASNPLTNVEFAGSSPAGERGVGGAFAQLEIKRGDWLQILGGLRYDRYDLKGTSYVITGRDTFSSLHLDSGEGRVSPTATVAVTPIKGLQLYGSYERGFRPPNLMETLLGGQHIGGGNVFLPNPNLKPEIAETYEAGVNLLFNEILREGDAFRAKISIYSTEVENFITQAVAPNRFDRVQNVNLSDPAKLKGLDLEASYDAGLFYFGGAASLIDATYVDAYKDAPSFENRLWSLYLAPKRKVTLDGGVRLFDRSLTVGARFTHVKPDQIQGASSQSSALYRQYNIVDVYASYKINENFTVRAAVENLTDRAYVDAMASQLTASPGRTATLGVTARF